MATTSSVKPQPVLIALPDSDRRQIHIVVRQPIPEVREAVRCCWMFSCANAPPEH